MKTLVLLSMSCCLFVSGSRAATDIVVDASATSPFLGTNSHPYKTITQAIINGPTPGDRILVEPGTYDVALGESFPIPVPDGVDIVARVSANRPRIGGDVQSSSVRSLIEIDATSGDRTGILLQKLLFVGENTALKDAPSAVYVENANGKLAEVTLDSCVIERSEMHDTIDRPSIWGVAGDAGAGGGLDLTLIGCTVVPTIQGGVEIGVGADAAGAGRAFANLEVRNSDFLLTGSQASRCAIDFLLECWTGTTGLNADGTCAINGNTIDSRSCTSGAFGEGIMAGADARYGGSAGMGHSVTHIEDNSILGCAGDAIHWFCDQDGSSGANVQSWFTVRNTCQGNGGNGLCIDYGDGTGAGGGPYMDIRTLCMMIVDNGGSAICIKNADAGSQGNNYVSSCTLAGNGGYGLDLSTCGAPDRLTGLQNTILWDNASGAATGWDPDVDPIDFTNNDYEGYFGASPSCTPDANDNVDTNPSFQNSGSGDYHLHSGSCLIGKGTNTPDGVSGSNFDHDFEGSRRIVNGQADIGADEKG